MRTTTGLREASATQHRGCGSHQRQRSQPFTSRFTTYLDENGNFTIPVTAAISEVKLRRWDNGLVAVFARPTTGGASDPCSPTVASASMTFGDVNGDGVIDDADLLTVLFGFGSSE